jgi:hypothetical protein
METNELIRYYEAIIRRLVKVSIAIRVDVDRMASVGPLELKDKAHAWRAEVAANEEFIRNNGTD